jgi:uncharacterized protein (DUF305 family)
VTNAPEITGPLSGHLATDDATGTATEANGAEATAPAAETLDDTGNGDDQGDPGDPGDGGGGDDEDLAGSGPTGLSWSRVAVLGAALAFLGFAVGTFLNRDQPPAESSVDVGFYQDMLTHHEQALELSSLALSNATDPTVRGFASEVLIFQSREIGMMETKLQEWGYSRANRPDTAMAWMGMDPVPVDQMPGLLSDDQVDQLRQARGAEADALFLELMAEHHAGGLHMAEYAANQADDHDVLELAERMAYNQAVEINEYAQTAQRLGLPIEIDRVPVPSEPSDHH